MFIIFFNKPVSLLPYLAGIIAFLMWAWKGGIDPTISFPVNIVNFSVWYGLFLVRYYIIGGEELIFWKVNIGDFSTIFNWYLSLYAIAIIAINLMIYKTGDGFIPIFILAFYGGISTLILEGIVRAKFLTEGFKHNTSIRGMQIDDIYQEFRQAAINKLIKSKENYY